MDKQRSIVLDLAHRAIGEVRGDRVVERAASGRFDVPLDVAAIGKAACAMMSGAHRAFGANIKRSLLVTRTGYLTPDIAGRAGIEIYEAGHPVPDAASLAAGLRLLEWLAEADETTHVLFLISGGTSSLVEVPVRGIDLTELQTVNRWLLASGLDIRQINSVRRQLSRIKGGGLLREAGQRRISVWLLSDVPGDDPAVIGSGMLYPAPDVESPAIDYPAAVSRIMSKLRDRPRARGKTSAHVPEHRVLANLRMACEAARAAAERWEVRAWVHEPELEGDAETAGRRLASRLLDMPPGVHIWGGETTLCLPASPGRGGRNQHLALAAATELAGRQDICLLALGTDGSDGPGDDAGALVDGGTVARGELDGLSADEALRSADSGTFLEASGDLVSTGVTGTNVRDLVIAIKTGRQQ